MGSIKINGEVNQVSEFSFDDLAGFGAEARIDDIRKLGSKREGSGVHLKSLLNRVGLKSDARYITFHSPSDDFLASVPLDRVIDSGVVVYAMNGEPMPRDKGGPFRFVIPDPAACGTDDIDECVNVKFLEEIILTKEKGRDTRPDDEDEHAALHADEN